MGKRELAGINRIVIKVGTSVITDRNNLLDPERLREIARQISRLKDAGYQIVLVTSGAIAAGMGLLNLKRRPKLLPELQASAAIGQGRLMKLYDDVFQEYGRLTAQILLTREDVNVRQRYLNARNTLSTLLECGCIPIVNENDTVSVDEIRFGDNDQLAGLVSILINADLLIVLSDVDGLYTSDPQRSGEKQLIAEVRKISSQIMKAAGGTKKESSVGGMATKLEAARIVSNSGIPMIIANGHLKNVLSRVVEGEEIGTLFRAGEGKLQSRRCWIAFGGISRGKIMVDEGARSALVNRGKSLLSSGVVTAEGKFKTGDIVSIIDERKKEFARGITNYESSALSKIKGLNSDQIKSVLGYKDYDEVVHRDNLVILRK